MTSAEPRSAFAIAALLTPAAFSHPVTRLELHETHISWVILTGSFAYKIKKAIHLDFIDASTLALRRHLCEEEVRLNRRMAAELYVGVVAITREAQGFCFEGQGPVVEYAVKMQQFDQSAELLSLLATATVTIEEIIQFGEHVAQFHVASTPARSDDYAYTERQAASIRANLAAVKQLDVDAEPALRQLVDWTQHQLCSLQKEFCDREQSGFIRECHGDLHARNIVRWRGELTAFDCLEFDPDLRWIDVINDVAFLVMDLVDHRRKDLALAFLNRYSEVSGDYAGLALLPFYAVYRALVRAKVDAISAQQHAALRTQFNARLHSRLQTALNFMAPAPPTLFIMHGPSGSGKSWLSERLVPAVPAIRIRSDLERKRLAGMGALEHGGTDVGAGIYNPDFSQRTYERLRVSAESCLRGGMNTLVDAAFLNSTERQVFQELASNLHLRFIVLSCHADPSVLAARIVHRQQQRSDPSDANVAVLHRQLQSMTPLGADEQPFAITVNTSAPGALTSVLDALNQRR